jgi:hypothetical protein
MDKFKKGELVRISKNVIGRVLNVPKGGRQLYRVVDQDGHTYAGVPVKCSQRRYFPSLRVLKKRRYKTMTYFSNYVNIELEFLYDLYHDIVESGHRVRLNYKGSPRDHNPLWRLYEEVSDCILTGYARKPFNISHRKSGWEVTMISGTHRIKNGTIDQIKRDLSLWILKNA